jgi:hypothetical protein
MTYRDHIVLVAPRRMFGWHGWEWRAYHVPHENFTGVMPPPVRQGWTNGSRPETELMARQALDVLLGDVRNEGAI